MKLLIVDDESLARTRLRTMVEKLPGWEVAGEADNGKNALDLVEQTQPDVVLLDIRMGGMDGLQVARALAGMAVPPAVVFTTAFGEHALSAFDAGSVAYLLKPIRAERLGEALRRARRPSQAQLLNLQRLRDNAPERSFIVANTRRGVTRIPIEDVICFEADQKYTTVHHMHGEVLTEESLRSLQNDLGDWFLRIHRKTLVAKYFMAGLGKASDGHYYLEMRHIDKRFAVSRRRLTEVRHLLAVSD